MLTRTRAALVALIAMVVAFLSTSTAYAQTADVETAVNDGFSQLTSTLTTVLVPALFGLVILGVVIALAVKYIKRGASKA